MKESSQSEQCAEQTEPQQQKFSLHKQSYFCGRYIENIIYVAENIPHFKNYIFSKPRRLKVLKLLFLQ